MSRKCAVACTGCDWAFESDDPYKLFIEAIRHVQTKHKAALKRLRMRE